MSTLREIAGVLVYDAIPFELRLRRDWTRIRNRNERVDANASGVRCDWRWTSDLHIARVFPSAGLRLMRKAFAEWPIAFGDAIVDEPSPRVSFLIGHRGHARLPHLLHTIRSIAGQRDTSIECIVVEQSPRPEVAGALPTGVRYIHTPVPESLPYCRSWAFNVAARAARGDVLILHDNDTVVPSRYAAAAYDAIAAGYDFANIVRFVFYLRSTEPTLDEPPERAVQNTQGLSVIARRNAYFAIGGYDEAFVGWGGEDNDFWDRAATMRVQRYGSVPMMHLWHAPQPEKALGDRAPAVARYRELEQQSPQARIARLTEVDFGHPDRPPTEGG